MNSNDYDKMLKKSDEQPDLSFKQRNEQDKERIMQSRNSRGSWLTFFETYNGHYALQFLGILLVFLGILFTVNHAIKAGTITPSTGIYSCLVISCIAAFIGAAFLSKKKSEEGLVALGGALVVAYGALVIGFKDYALFSSTTTFLGVIALAAASLLVAYEKNSQLVALLGIGFAGYFFRLDGPVGLLPYMKFFMVYGVAMGALLVALKKRWTSTALISYLFLLFTMLFSPLVSEPWHFLALFGAFTLIPLIYAFFAKTDSYLESLIITVVTTTFFGLSLNKYLFRLFAFLFFTPSEGAHAPFYLKASVTAMAIGALFLLAFFIFYKRKGNFSPLQATVYGLFYMLCTGALLSLIETRDILAIHYFTWLLGIVGFLRHNMRLCKVALVVELYHWIAPVFGTSMNQANFQGWGILLLSLLALVGGSFGIRHLLSKEDVRGARNFKTIVYGLGLSAVLFAWAVIAYYKIGAPYISLFPALYGLILLGVRSDQERVVTRWISGVSFGLTALYGLKEYISLDYFLQLWIRAIEQVGFNWMNLISPLSTSPVDLQKISISLLSVLIFIGGSFSIVYFLSDKDARESISFKDIIYGFGLSTVLFAWVVIAQYGLGAPYIGLFPALYGLIIALAVPSDRQKVVTASISTASFGLTVFYVLSRYILVQNEHLFFPKSRFYSQAAVSLFALLKEATILLGITALIGFLLYRGIGKRKKSVIQNFYRRMQSLSGGTALLALFLLVRLYLIACIRFGVMVSQNKVSSFFQFLSLAVLPLPGSLALYENSILTAYYALTGLALVVVGSAYRKSSMRLTGIILLLSAVGWIIYRLVFGSQGFAEQFVLLAIGVIALGASFFYRHSKRES